MTRWLALLGALVGCGDDGGTKYWTLDLHVRSVNGGVGTVLVVDNYGSIRENCDDDCSHTVAWPPNVELTPEPDPASTFDGWSGGCGGGAVTLDPIRVDGDAGGSTECTATFRGRVPLDRDYITVASPEGMGLFHVGANRPSGMPVLSPPGLADGTYVAVAGGAGGLDLVHLETAARTTNTFVSAGAAAYGVSAYQDARGPLFTVFGSGGTATTGWNNTDQTFGGTFLGLPQNTTQVAVSDVNDDGTIEKVLTTAPNGTIYVQPFSATGSEMIDGTAYAATAAQPVSAQFGRTTDEVIVVLVDGRVFFGPIAGAAGRLALVGTAGASPRLMQCAGTTTRVCAIADYGGDAVHILELGASGAELTAMHVTGDAPIDPDVVMTGATARIAVTGSADNSIEVFAYDPATNALTVDVARAPLASCMGPNHVRWLGPSEVIVSCYMGGGLVRKPL